MRKELERKLSGQGSSNKKFNFDIGVAGHRVTRKDNMVIIEKSEGTTVRPDCIIMFLLSKKNRLSFVTKTWMLIRFVTLLTRTLI